MGYKPGLQPNADYIAIKMPVFSFEKIRGAETSLGPEMKSTGECLGIAKTFNEALYKAFLGAGVVLPKHKKIIISVKDADKQEVVPLAQRFEKLGYEVYATRSTADVLRENGVDAIKVNKIHQEAPTVMDLLLEHKIDIVIDTPTQGRDKNRDGFLIRRTSIETGVNCFTSLDTVDALLTSLESDAKNDLSLVDIAINRISYLAFWRDAHSKRSVRMDKENLIINGRYLVLENIGKVSRGSFSCKGYKKTDESMPLKGIFRLIQMIEIN